jgi:putative ABC transport system permease protein
VEALSRDLRLAFRKLAKSPGFVAAAASSLALALGANTAIFSLANAILLRPIPGVSETDALVNVHPVAPGESGDFGAFSYPDYADLRDRSRGLSALAAFNGRGMSFGSGDHVELVGGQLVSGNYFSVLGTRAHLGRLLEERDDTPAGASAVAVVSYALWQGRLGADPAVVGREIRLNGFPFTVVGVAEPGFAGHFTGFPFDVYAPLGMTPQAAPNETLGKRDSEWLELVGRLGSGVSLASAQAELAALATGLERERPAPQPGRSIVLTPVTGLDDSLRGPVIAFLAILQGAASLLLALACVNVAGLLLARAAERRKEMAVRLAIGARASHLVRQLLSEALLLFGLGGVLGTLLAAWTAGLLVEFQPRFPIPLRLDLSLDMRVLAFGALCTLATGVLFGLVPAWEAARVSLVPALKDLDRGAGSRLRRAFVAGQVALSLVLLTIAGLFLRSLGSVQGLDPGFRIAGVHLASVNLALLPRDEVRGRAFYRQLLERLHSTPGVDSASLAQVVPLSLGFGSLGALIQVDGHETPAAGGFRVDLNAVTPRYFETLSLPLVGGRGFEPGDSADAPGVAIVSEALSRRFWPDQGALGQRLRWRDRSWRVVGIARDSATRRLGEEARPHLYVPFDQSYSPGMTVLARGAAAIPLGAVLRREIRALDPDLPILGEMPLGEFVGRSLAPQRMAGVVSAVLAGFGLVLATLGVYGLVAHFVVRRRREVGLRVALGARPLDVTRLFLGEGVRLACLGTGLGLAGAAAVTRVLAAFLPGVSPLDPLAFSAAAALMAATAALASLVPARRAARLDPLSTLRE